MEQKKGNIFLKIIKGLLITVLSVILVINIYIMIQAKSNPKAVPSLFGYKPFIVLSGSMETQIYVGDLVIVKEVDSNTLKKNDIIAFRDSENLVTTHRIVNVINNDKGLCFETKGDNNNTKDDGIVCSNNVEGKYQTRIPKLGNAIMFIQEPLGFTVMMLSILIICIFIYFINSRKIDKEMIIDKDELKEFEEFKKAKQQRKTDK